MKAYLLNADALDGIITGIGIVKHGTPVIARTPEQEELLDKDPRFKVTRIKAEDAATLTASESVVVPNAEAATDTTSKAAKGSKGDK